MEILIDFFLESSRKDDLEAIFYNLIFFINGDMPWGINNENATLKDILSIKQNIMSEYMC